MNTKKLPLTIESDTLNAFKSDFNQMLRKLLNTMEMQDAEEGVLNAKINVSLKQDKARDFQTNGYDGTRDITKPTFSHKIGISFQFKDEKSGTLGGNYEMVWDKELNAYVMVEINNGQTTMFEDDEKHETATDEIVDARAIPESKAAAALPSPESLRDEEFEERKESFEYISRYVGQDMKIFSDSGLSSVRSLKGGNIVLTSAGTAKDIFRADHDVLTKHVGHEAVCNGTWIQNDDGTKRLIRVSIECIECGETLWCMDNPEEDVGYVYEDPEA